MKRTRKPKIGFALGAGGGRGFCHVGFLQAMEENGIKPKFIAGSSMGAMVGGCYATGVSVARLKEMSDSTKQTMIYDMYLNMKNRLSVFQGKHITKILQTELGDKNIEDTKIRCKLTAVDLLSGRPIIIDKGPLWQAVRASISIPGIFLPVETDGMLLIDGGVLNRVPAAVVRGMGAELVISVDALGPVRPAEPPTNLMRVVERYYEIADWAIAEACDVKQISDMVITPDLGDKSPFDFKNNHLMVDAGYSAAKAAMPELKELIAWYTEKINKADETDGDKR